MPDPTTEATRRPTPWIGHTHRWRTGSSRARGVRRRLVACVPLVLIAVVAGPLAAAPVGALAPARDRLAPVVLDRPVRAEAAIASLGAALTRVATQNDLAAGKLRELLRSDPTLWVDTRGQLLAIDDHLPAPAPAPAPSTAPAPATRQAPFPDTETFRLHSLPGASRVVHIDFDGHTVTGTAWAVSTAPQPRFDTDGKPATFSASEHDQMQRIWRRVAEDFAPFAVDVTTEEPAASDLERTSSGDSRFGTRVLVTPGREAHDAICGGCGGIAYIGTFDLPGTNTYYQPAWVFPHMLSNNEKYIAEAVSHEAGHNLGLHHDGVSGGDPYYRGHGMWAPIMGIGYDRPLVQFSAGEYGGANSLQDDLAVVAASGAPRRTDDHGDTPGSGTGLAGGPRLEAAGVLSTRGDTDVFSVDHGCAGPLRATVTGAPSSPNADLQLRLLAQDGSEVARDDPPVAGASFDLATGLGASLDVTVPAGRYHVEVDGVGALDPSSTGSSDYGSLGSYALVVEPCTSAGTPALSVSDVSVVEGNAGSRSAAFEVALSAPSTETVRVTMRTADGSAVAPGDYAAKAASVLYFSPGQTSKRVWVSVKGDRSAEPSETFTLELSTASGATIADARGVATITDDDAAAPAPFPALSVSDVSVVEGNAGSRSAAFEVALSAPSTKTVRVTMRTADGSAVAPGDYAAKAASVLYFSPGQTSKRVWVSVKGDRSAEPSETFTLELSTASGATVADARGVATITDDD